MQKVDWGHIEGIRRRSFHSGVPLSQSEEQECLRAIKEDAERYDRIGEHLRDEYKASFCGVPR